MQLGQSLPQAKGKISESDSINAILTKWASENYAWNCQPSEHKALNTQGTVTWSKWNCTGKFPLDVLPQSGKPIAITINVVDADLTDSSVSIKPIIAEIKDPNAPYTETLSDMAQSRPSLLAAINGGYFFINEPTFTDTNCPWKKYPQITPDGVGDGILTIDGKTYSVNCPNTKPRATIAQDTQGNWSVQNIEAGVTPTNLAEGLGAGPLMVMNGKIVMDWQAIPSTFEYSANTAVSLATDNNAHPHLQLFTVDGINKEAGMYSFEMANLIYTQYPKLFNLNVTQAMSMDQGGSTTMIVNGSVVSKSSKSGQLRPIYDALGIFTNDK